MLLSARRTSASSLGETPGVHTGAIGASVLRRRGDVDANPGPRGRPRRQQVGADATRIDDDPPPNRADAIAELRGLIKRWLREVVELHRGRKRAVRI
ncbi:MAG: hypothetical protein R3C16_01500 [Hyphomonadaceae bacterium]